MAYRNRILQVIVAAAALGSTGCAQVRDTFHAIFRPSPGAESTPSPRPTYLASAPSTWTAPIAAHGAPAGVVMAQFAEWDGSSPVPLPVSPALRQSVIAHLNDTGQFAMVDDDRLAQRVHDVLQWHRRDLARKLAPIASLNAQVRYVVLGRVAQFAHVTHSPRDLRGWTPSQHQREAIVGLHLRVVDLHERRLIMDEVVTGRAWASEKPVGEMYRGISVQSARFADTPLGLACRDAAQSAAARLNSLTQTSAAPSQTLVRVVDRLDGRRVQLSSEASSQTKPGETFVVAIYDQTGASLMTVLDPVMQMPLQARIEKRSLRPTAWLMGEPPADVELRGAVLVPREAASRVAGVSNR